MGTRPAEVAHSSAGAHARRLYLDNVKALLIAAIIVMHAVLGYAGMMDWFVGVLLIFSLAYAVLRAMRPEARPRSLELRHLVLLAAVVAPASFAVRLVYP